MGDKLYFFSRPRHRTGTGQTLDSFSVISVLIFDVYPSDKLLGMKLIGFDNQRRILFEILF